MDTVDLLPSIGHPLISLIYFIIKLVMLVIVFVLLVSLFIKGIKALDLYIEREKRRNVDNITTNTDKKS